MSQPREPFFTPEHSDTGYLTITLDRANRLIEPLLRSKASTDLINEMNSEQILELIKENERLRADLSTCDKGVSLEARQELAALKAEIEQAPVVEGYLINGKFIMGGGLYATRATHKARLVRIEEIKK